MYTTARLEVFLQPHSSSSCAALVLVLLFFCGGLNKCSVASDRTFVTVLVDIVVVVAAVNFDGQVKECLVSFQLLNKLSFYRGIFVVGWSIAE